MLDVKTNLQTGRKLRPAERLLIIALAPGFGVGLDDALVAEMQDGGMGSIRFLGGTDRRRAGSLAHAKYVDDDGVTVRGPICREGEQEGDLHASQHPRVLDGN